MKLKNRTLLFIGILLLCLLTLPYSSVENFRGRAIASFSWLWNLFLQEETKNEERLTLENQLLKNEIAYLNELVKEEQEISRQLVDAALASAIDQEELSKHQKEALEHFHLKLIHLPARVIFRPINTWDSSLWIDKGEVDNQRLGRMVIAKNSPVVIGTSVVGLVDFVGEKQSQVRLITDSHLNLSVRVKRGLHYLAKGELIGKSEAYLRSHRTLLKGIGFNYDFADAEGPARDLRTGKPTEKNSPYPTLPLIQINDLLITTGMDGVFPPNLEVGIVKKIAPLKEGDCTYSLEAESLLKELNSLKVVFVLPPQ